MKHAEFYWPIVQNYACYPFRCTGIFYLQAIQEFTTFTAPNTIMADINIDPITEEIFRYRSILAVLDGLVYPKLTVGNCTGFLVLLYATSYG